MTKKLQVNGSYVSVEDAASCVEKGLSALAEVKQMKKTKTKEEVHAMAEAFCASKKER